MKNRLVLAGLSAAVLSFLFTAFSSNGVYANVASTDWNDTVTRKALLQGVSDCYNKGGINKTVRLGGGEQLMFYPVQGIFKASNKVALPSGLTNIKEDEVATCMGLFANILDRDNGSVMNTSKGKVEYLDIFSLAGKAEWSGQVNDPVVASKVVTGMGYEVKSATSGCRTLYYGAVGRDGKIAEGDYVRKSPTICYRNGEIQLNPYGLFSDGLDMTVDGKKLIVSAPGDFGHTKDDFPAMDRSFVKDGMRQKEYTITDYANFLSVINDIHTDFYEIYASSDGAGLNNYLFRYLKTDGADDIATDYQILYNNTQAGFNKALETLSPGMTAGKLSFTKEEKIAYYVSAIKNSFLSQTEGKGNNNTEREYDYSYYYHCDITDKEVMKNNYYQINIDIMTGVKKSTCGFDKVSGLGTINGFKNSTFDTSGKTTLNFVQTIAEINHLVGDVEEGASIIDPDDGGASNVGNTADCYGAGLDSQSWIICPAINNMTSVVDGLDGMVGSLLVTKTAYYDASSKTYSAWQTFRDIANVFIGVVLMLIILSQLTGYGIDNYGIKKMLPKLIIMAVLINLSFFICQAAIDLSNILGDGLDQLFRGIAGSTGEESANIGRYMAGFVMGSFGSIAAAGSALEFGSLAIGAATGGGVTVAISLLLALLVVLVSVLLFFIMVGARTIIVILFTAIAPVAFALYILPNTQKYFKKWWDIFKAALVIYPICGALYGISFLIRTITPATGSFASLGDFAIQLAAVIAPFLPFLILPTLLKSAINALGVVGGAISSLGGSLRKGISSSNRALQGTNAYKAGMENSRRNMTRWNAGLDKDGRPREIGRFGRFVRGGDKGMAAARSQFINDKKNVAREGSMMEGVGLEAALVNQTKLAEAEDLKDRMTLLNHLTRNGEDKDELYRLIREDQRFAGDKTSLVGAARIAGRRKDTAVDFLDKLRNETSKYAKNDELLKGVAKEIATGENSGIYRSSSPLGFGWASAVNKGDTSSYTDWKAQNALGAIDAFVTDSKELTSMKGSELKELNGLVGEWIKSGDDAAKGTAMKIQSMASDAIANRDKIPIDYSKAEQIAALTGGAWTYENGNFISHTANVGAAPVAPAPAPNGAAAQNEVFTVQQPSNVGSALAADQFAATAAPQKPSVQDDRPARGTYKSNENGDWVKK